MIKIQDLFWQILSIKSTVLVIGGTQCGSPELIYTQCSGPSGPTREGAQSHIITTREVRPCFVGCDVEGSCGTDELMRC